MITAKKIGKIVSKQSANNAHYRRKGNSLGIVGAQLHARSLEIAIKSKMANRTVSDAKTVKGTNPQYLIEKIVRSRIYENKYWKEQCFALSGKSCL